MEFKKKLSSFRGLCFRKLHKSVHNTDSYRKFIFVCSYVFSDVTEVLENKDFEKSYISSGFHLCFLSIAAETGFRWDKMQQKWGTFYSPN
jgi:hypothetical protein